MNIIDKAMSILAPQICLGCGTEGSVLCEECISAYAESVQPRCAGCKKLSEDFKVCSSCKKWLPLDHVYVASNYEGIAEQIIKKLKFAHARDAAQVAATIMSPLVSKASMLCPIPTAPARIRQRGFDHTLLITKHLANLTESSLASLLQRQDNARQLGSSRKQRMKQMETEFVIDKKMAQDTPLLIVDDVMTTGATLAAAAKTLRKAGFTQVSAIVFSQKLN